jgi:HEAT repeat protein
MTMLVAWTLAVRAGENDAEQAADEKMLKDAGLKTDGDALLNFFRQRTLSDVDMTRLREAIHLLGDDDFHVREKATNELSRAGRAAWPLLRQALRDSDPEVVFRARRCLAGAEQPPELSLTACAARLLAVRRPPETVPTLLAFVPFVDDDYVRDAILHALVQAGSSEGKPDPALVAAAGDKQSARRAAAAHVLARCRGTDRELVLRLLNDADSQVRFRAAAGLVHGHDKAGVPALIALFTSGDPEIAREAEDLLCRLAGETMPSASLGLADETSRKKCRDAWESWWKESSAKIDFTHLDAEETPLGLTVISDCDVKGQFRTGSVWECGADGKPRWHFEGVKNPADIQILPGGRLLIAECQGFVVTERDRQGKVLWSHTVDSYPVSCQRLANGNTFIATYNEFSEVTRDGKKVYARRINGSVYCAQKLRNGNILFAHSTGKIVEMQPSGREVHSLRVEGLAAWAGVELLPNGHYLIAQYGASRVVEMDQEGKVHWEAKVNTPAWCTRLRNGNTLVASTESHSVIELDRSGKEVWKQPTEGRPFRVRRH